jgi:hypothetical protein
MIKRISDFANLLKVSCCQISLFRSLFFTHHFFLWTQQVYPQGDWDVKRFAESPGIASQRLLCSIVQKIFPDKGDFCNFGFVFTVFPVIREDYHHPSLLTESGYPLELDIFIPELSLAFEYQGIQHYTDVYQAGNSSTYLLRCRFLSDHWRALWHYLFEEMKPRELFAKNMELH